MSGGALQPCECLKLPCCTDPCSCRAVALVPAPESEAWLLKVLTSITNLGLYTTKNEGDVLTDSQLDQGVNEGQAVGSSQSQDEFSMRTFEREVGFRLLRVCACSVDCRSLVALAREV